MSDEEIARLEKEASEQGDVVSQIKEVCTPSFCSIWAWRCAATVASGSCFTMRCRS